MPATKTSGYQVVPIQSSGIPTIAASRFKTLQNDAQIALEELNPDQQRLVFMRLANWCLQNAENLSYTAHTRSVGDDHQAGAQAG